MGFLLSPPFTIRRFVFSCFVLPCFLFPALLTFALPHPIFSQPDESNNVSAPIAGTYELRADGRLFLRSLRVEVRPEERTWSARILAVLDGAPDARCVRCGGPAQDRPLVGLEFIHGLEARNGEYVYGRVLLPDSGLVRRCKAWRHARSLYLRVYEPGRYTTLELRAEQ